eukprot:CAMPEP_0198700072 /NCGR_PEP_ID=MMETSP1468-20131203/363931_1 /TAXON_ID=1461545 /ORGANISM="Mantoniella sp, Strain CCMP1436" /LENGTH=31 /DNA_ID= /DNA_START= /DNA_END= /DNA_ORIENTATION=
MKVMNIASHVCQNSSVAIVYSTRKLTASEVA